MPARNLYTSLIDGPWKPKPKAKNLDSDHVRVMDLEHLAPAV